MAVTDLGGREESIMPVLRLGQPAPQPVVPQDITLAPDDRALPSWQVEDRQSYWRAIDQIEQQKQELARLQQIAQQRMSQFGGAFDAISNLYQQGFAIQEQERQRQPQDFRTISQIPGTPEEQATAPSTIPQRRASFFNTFAPVAEGAYNLARTDIPAPIREPATRLAEQAIRNAPGVSSALTALDVAQRFGASPVGGQQVAEMGADLAVPRELWELALELVPGTGTVPDLMRAVKSQSPEAVRALRTAIESDAGQRIIAKVASERGAMEPGKIVPTQVRGLFARRGSKAIKTLTEEELAARWDALPPSTQKLVTALADVVPTREQRSVIRKAGTSGQTARAVEAITDTQGMHPDERTRAIANALKGKYMPGFKPVRERFDEAEVAEIFGRMDEAVDGGEIIPQEYARAQSAMNLLFYGERTPGFPGPDNLMLHEIKMLGRIYGPEFEAALPRTKDELTLGNHIIDALSAPRTLQAAFDASAPFRQGIILGIRNPDYWFKAWGKQFRGMKSEEAFAKVAQELRTDPHFASAVKHGVDFTDIKVGGDVAEEQFRFGRLAEKIPGVQASERGYVAYLDYLRLKTYGRGERRILRTAEKHGWDAARKEEALKQWAYFVNVASGRGDVSALKSWAPALNAVFFSPRFFVSRPQSVWQLVRPGEDPAVRLMVFENVGALAAMGMSLLTTLQMTGAASVELDPRSTDFGKIRIGKQRIDFWAGFQPLARYLAQISMRQRKDPYSRENVPVGAWETARKFIRSKLSPTGAAAWDFLIESGRDYQGKEIVQGNPYASVPKYLSERVIPIGLNDIYEGYKEAGLVGAGVATGGLVGLNVQSYSPTERQALVMQLEAGGVNVTHDTDGRTIIQFDKADEAFRTDDWRDAFRDGGFPTIDKYQTITDLKRAYVEKMTPVFGKDSGLGEKQSKIDAGNAFEQFAVVKEYRKKAQAYALTFWQNHPDLLRIANDAGLNPLNEEERKILEENPTPTP